MGASTGLDCRLVGRAHETAAARRSLQDGRAGVVFAGPPGVGKTAMARALVDELADRDDSEVLWLVGPASEGLIPFGAFAALAPETGARPGRRPDPLYLMQNIRTSVVRRAHGRPLILGVDDAHRLDTESASLLFQLVTTAGARLVMTMRTGVPTPAPLRSLWKEELIERIEVRPLDHDDTFRMVADLLGAADPDTDAFVVGGELGEAIWRVAAGNPLYIRELVRGTLAEGRIVPRDGAWRLDGEPAIDARIRDILEEEVADLDQAATEALRLVAMAEPLPLRVLRRVASDDALDRLERRGLVAFAVGRGESVARVRHPLVAAAVRDAIPATTASHLGCRLADAFTDDGRFEQELLRVVTWRLDGGCGAEPADLLRAAYAAAEAQSWVLCARLAQAAQFAGAGFDARIALADALRAQGRFGEALDALGDDPGRGSDQLARSTVLRAAILFFGIGQREEAHEVLAGAAPLLSDASDRAWVAAVAAGFRGFEGRAEVAVQAGTRLLGQVGLSPRAEGTVRAVLAMGLSWLGQSETALQVLEGQPAAAIRSTALAHWYHTARALAYRQSGRVDALEAFCRARYDTAVAVGDGSNQGNAAVGLGTAALERAELSRAAMWFRDATLTLGSAEGMALRVHAMLGLAETLALAGDIEAARAALDDAKPMAMRAPLLQPGWSVAAAWLAAAQGAISEALAQLDTAARRARNSGQTAPEIEALHAAVRMGSTAGRLRVQELATWVEGPLMALIAEHVAALDAGEQSGAALDAVAAGYAGQGLILFAVEAAAQASRAHQRAGELRRAASSVAFGHSLLSAGEPGPVPLGLRLAMAPPELTRREREVAMLAAKGLPSPVIASRLCLSVRTVETHLARVYSKLGIAGRSELAEVLDSVAAGDDRG